MVTLHYLAPIHQLLPMPFKYAGVPLVLGGICVTAVAARAFTRVGTPVVPFEKSTVVVTNGLFRFSRNPMYLGMVMALVGVAMLLRSAAAFGPIPIFAWLVYHQFIHPEEQFLEELLVRNIRRISVKYGDGYELCSYQGIERMQQLSLRAIRRLASGTAADSETTTRRDSAS